MLTILFYFLKKKEMWQEICKTSPKCIFCPNSTNPKGASSIGVMRWWSLVKVKRGDEWNFGKTEGDRERGYRSGRVFKRVLIQRECIYQKYRCV